MSFKLNFIGIKKKYINLEEADLDHSTSAFDSAKLCRLGRTT